MYGKSKNKFRSNLHRLYLAKIGEVSSIVLCIQYMIRFDDTYVNLKRNAMEEAYTTYFLIFLEYIVMIFASLECTQVISIFASLFQTSALLILRPRVFHIVDTVRIKV